jgi:hypothetical protein
MARATTEGEVRSVRNIGDLDALELVMGLYIGLAPSG